ncbi:MAG: DNA primase, partial [Xanthobacteraceae bacterium]
VLAAARPLAQVLWARESEAGPFDTPERRAAFEARVGEVTATITDEAVRRYYRQDFSEKLRRMFTPAEISTRRGNFNKTGFNRGPTGKPYDQRTRPGSVAGSAASTFGRDDTYVAVSANLAAGPLHRGHRAAIPRREALILQAALNHPWLLHDHLEELAAAEFRHADTQRLKGALIDVFAHHFAEGFANDTSPDGAEERAALSSELAKRGFGDVLERIHRSITTLSVWGAGPNAAAADVLLTWKQLVALHRQWHSLTRELRDAETALGADNTEANYARLRDVKARLSSLDGTEALVEGFGASSGRTSRSL